MLTLLMENDVPLSLAETASDDKKDAQATLLCAKHRQSCSGVPATGDHPLCKHPHRGRARPKEGWSLMTFSPSVTTTISMQA